MEMIDRVLAISRFTLMDMDGLAVTVGPGSFTGLRIGLSAIKGLSMGANLPVVGVGSLDALALPFSHSDKLLCAMMDARRHEVYSARYRFDGDSLIIQAPPEAAIPEQAVSDIHEPCIFAGDGAVVYRDRLLDVLGDLAVFAPICHNQIRASAVAACAMPRFKTGEVDDAAAMTPCYIRLSDAVKMNKR
jgi:tRNA threonylcarbamoyladenosine biosynthesis protein TsaB